MFPDASAAGFIPVAYEVVLRGENFANTLFLHKPLRVLIYCFGKRVVSEYPRARIRLLKEREFVYPGIREHPPFLFLRAPQIKFIRAEFRNSFSVCKSRERFLFYIEAHALACRYHHFL